jgi:hypothetical protein
LIRRAPAGLPAVLLLLIRIINNRVAVFPILVSRDPAPRKLDGIEFLSWELFLKRLWGDDLLRAKQLKDK